jgi:heptosyltransferase-2
LVVGPSWVGDMVMAQSLFVALHERLGQCRISVLAPHWSMALLDRMPEVSEALQSPFGHGDLGLRARWRFGRALRGRFDLALVLPNSWKSALVPWAAGIPQRIGWIGEQRWGLLTEPRRLDPRRLPMTVQRFVALAYPPDQGVPPVTPPRLRVDPDTVEASRRRLGLGLPQRGVLALCPGAEYGPAKRWPEEAFAALAQQAHAAGMAVWLFGSDKDRPVCAKINQAAGGICDDLCGRTELAEAVDLLSLATAVVSNDSGLMHVAAALDRPLVALYGSSDPGFTPPLHERHRILHLGLRCSPCFQRECPLGHLKCLRDIRVDSVVEALADLDIRI